MWTELAIILALTLLNGFFAGAELAIISVRKSRLQELVEGGSKRATAIQSLRERPERFLATVQIGITVIGATAGAFGGSSLSVRLAPLLVSFGVPAAQAASVSLAVVVALISYLSLVLGELVPKSLALKFSEGYAMIVASPLRLLASLFRPVVWLLTASSNLFLRAFGDSTNFTESRVSPDELQSMVEEAARAGTLDANAGEIASRAFELGDLWVSESMVPRSEIVALPRRASAEEVRRVLLEESHSRMPVYDGSIDNIVGYVLAKDLFSLVMEKELIVLEDALRPVFFVPETKPAIDALKELQKRRTQMAIVVNELGGVEGLVTVEDLVEEVVGDIFGENDLPEELVVAQADGSLVAQGDAPLRELNRALETDFPDDEGVSTLAGLVMLLAGRIPEKGAVFTTGDDWKLEVLDATPRRVRSVRLTRPEPPPGEAGTESVAEE